MEDVTVVRIYFTEKDNDMDEVLAFFREQLDVEGITIFRGLAGFGHSGKIHQASWADLEMDLPVVVEFFDKANVIEGALETLTEQFEIGHVLTWPAQVKHSG